MKYTHVIYALAIVVTASMSYGEEAPKANPVKQALEVIQGVKKVLETGLTGVKKTTEFAARTLPQVPPIKNAIELSLKGKDDQVKIKAGFDAAGKLLVIVTDMTGKDGVLVPVFDLIGEIGDKIVRPFKPEDAKKMKDAMDIAREVTSSLSEISKQISKDILPSIQGLVMEIFKLIAELSGGTPATQAK